ncbi:aldo/keto reductase [Amycolatopsis antarctica]|uniref:Aldo/keto reductase n=1 Tax=Amycolatopsis antarctica TaxID=1854586 RepID=A0A263D6L5_9PSEU|nr:aldo/keto reductase [Amycolatopsis antarctica]OZM73116.1 aldo/keto reductase [Amycolatopsis antarctica]
MTIGGRIGLGLAALGRPAYINLGRVGALPEGRGVEAMRTFTHDVLDAAYAAGIRWVDTARSYGLAEEFLAGWLRDRGHADVTVSSKWGYAYVGDWRLDADQHEAKEHSLARFSTQWSETQGLLGSGVSLYQVHSLTSDSPLFADHALLAALAELAASGVRTGFSTSGPRQHEAIERGLALEVSGQRVFTAVQSTWNALEPSAGAALDQARAAGNLVLLKETLANGRLAVDAPELLVELAGDRGVTPDAIAVAVALAQPWADGVLLGPSGAGQLSSNLLASTVDIGDEDLARVAELAEPPEEYWNRRSALRWV